MRLQSTLVGSRNAIQPNDLLSTLRKYLLIDENLFDLSYAESTDLALSVPEYRFAKS